MGHLAEERASPSLLACRSEMPRQPPHPSPTPVGGAGPHRPFPYSSSQFPYSSSLDNQLVPAYDVTLAKPLPRSRWFKPDSLEESRGAAARPLTSSIWLLLDRT